MLRRVAFVRATRRNIPEDTLLQLSLFLMCLILRVRRSLGSSAEKSLLGTRPPIAWLWFPSYVTHGFHCLHYGDVTVCVTSDVFDAPQYDDAFHLTKEDGGLEGWPYCFSPFFTLKDDPEPSHPKQI
jgi:hypothetical protein